MKVKELIEILLTKGQDVEIVFEDNEFGDQEINEVVLYDGKYVIQ